MLLDYPTLCLGISSWMVGFLVLADGRVVCIEEFDKVMCQIYFEQVGTDVLLYYTRYLAKRALENFQKQATLDHKYNQNNLPFFNSVYLDTYTT